MSKGSCEPFTVSVISLLPSAAEIANESSTRKQRHSHLLTAMRSSNLNAVLAQQLDSLSSPEEGCMLKSVLKSSKSDDLRTSCPASQIAFGIVGLYNIIRWHGQRSVAKRPLLNLELLGIYLLYFRSGPVQHCPSI